MKGKFAFIIVFFFFSVCFSMVETEKDGEVHVLSEENIEKFISTTKLTFINFHSRNNFNNEKLIAMFA